MRVAASCQKEHPAGTVPSKGGIPAGGMSHKETAIGGWDNSNEWVNSPAIFWYLLIGAPLFMQRFDLGL